MATLGIDFGVTSYVKIINTNTLCTCLSSSSSVSVDNKTIKINIFDMGGQPFFYEVIININ